tara:strand:+ start:3378 stop:3626 length:249 start_codon:yes stop_codon:yes gene_type:complete
MEKMTQSKIKKRAAEMRLHAEKCLGEFGHLTLSELAYETSKKCRFQVGSVQLACILRGHTRIKKRRGYHRDHQVNRTIYYIE